MDTGMGTLAQISEEKAQELTTKNVDGVVRVGDKLTFNGINTLIHRIDEHFIQLRILKKEQVR